MICTLASDAAACPPGADEARIDATLARQAHKAHIWDHSWAAIFGGVTVAQGVMAAAHWVPGRPYDDDARAGLWVGMVKSGIGALGHLVLPLKIPRGGDRCGALHEAGKHEKAAFWLNHLGGLGLNLGGLLVLGLGYHAWSEGLMSFALGYPVALLSVYTQPRGAWHAQVVIQPDFRGVAIAGTF
jgi:hypothetical protein